MCRLIPARAGKTRRWRPGCAGWRAHPRACGENVIREYSLGADRGSSPRVRGKRKRLANTGCGTGLIPARAGKTRSATMTTPSSSAHPRACGENVQEGVGVESAPGSSPRVRGKPPTEADEDIDLGLIPARAGKTWWAPRDPSPRPAHPRACGENWLLGAQRPPKRGSSPRVRGKRLVGGPGGSLLGLIPARAGKTSILTMRACTAGAHPRACGENRARWCWDAS